LAPFLKTEGAPLAGFCFSEPGGSANAGSLPPGEGVRTLGKLDGKNWKIDGRKKWVSSATGWDRKGADVLCVVCRTDRNAPPEKGVSIIAVEGPAPGVRFTGTAALVGIFGVALMRSAFDFALKFAKTEKRGGVHPIIEHQAVGYALADAKTALESARYLSWRACHALDTQSPGAEELAIQAKIYGSETAVRVITDLMRIVGIESYDHDAPFGRLLRDALALPIFDGGNMGVRRRQLHAMLTQPTYDPLTACGGA
jgi:butyryl-CoA dehydrogenase